MGKCVDTSVEMQNILDGVQGPIYQKIYSLCLLSTVESWSSNMGEMFAEVEAVFRLRGREREQASRRMAGGSTFGGGPSHD
jgi:membrane protein required for beta-lactamase induction